MGLFGFGKNKENKLPWENLTSSSQIEKLIVASQEIPVLIYKHSTRCGISSMALSRLESSWNADTSRCKLVFLDLIAFRDVSNTVSEKLNVVHQSPQAILLKNGEVVYHASHSEINSEKIQSLI